MSQAISPPVPPLPPAHQRYAYIDTLRGLAALYVVFFHVAYVPYPKLLVSPMLLPLIQKGRSGVILFFVLSAFTMANSMRGRAGEQNRNLKFYIRRVFRIVPLYYFWLAVMVLRLSLAGGHYSLATMASALSFTFNFIPGMQEGIVWASWTLGVEMVFYLFFPLIFAYVTNVRRSVIFIVLAFALELGFRWFTTSLSIPPSELYSFRTVSFFLQLPAFGFGLLVFFIYEAMIENKPVQVGWSVLLVSLSVMGFILYAFLLPDFAAGTFGGLYIEAVLFSGLVLGLSIRPWKLIVNRLTIFLGTISYSVYLVHPIVIQYSLPLYRQLYRMPLRSTISYALCALGTVLVVIVIAYLTYRLIEKPGMSFGSRLTKKISLHAAPQGSLAAKPTE